MKKYVKADFDLDDFDWDDDDLDDDLDDGDLDDDLDGDLDTECLYEVYIDYPGNPVYTLATYRQLNKLQDHREIHSFKEMELTPIEEIDDWGVLKRD